VSSTLYCYRSSPLRCHRHNAANRAAKTESCKLRYCFVLLVSPTPLSQHAPEIQRRGSTTACRTGPILRSTRSHTLPMDGASLRTRTMVCPVDSPDLRVLIQALGVQQAYARTYERQYEPRSAYCSPRALTSWVPDTTPRKSTTHFLSSSLTSHRYRRPSTSHRGSPGSSASSRSDCHR
jgi:hypothetical protein